MEAAVWTVQQLQFVGRANAVAAPQQAVSGHRAATGAFRLDDDNRYDLAIFIVEQRTMRQCNVHGFRWPVHIEDSPPFPDVFLLGSSTECAWRITPPSHLDRRPEGLAIFGTFVGQ